MDSPKRRLYHSRRRPTGQGDEARRLIPTINPDVTLALEVVLANVHLVCERLGVLVSILDPDILPGDVSTNIGHRSLSRRALVTILLHAPETRVCPAASM
jgi:hypothetical protein